MFENAKMFENFVDKIMMFENAKMFENLMQRCLKISAQSSYKL